MVGGKLTRRPLIGSAYGGWSLVAERGNYREPVRGSSRRLLGQAPSQRRSLQVRRSCPDPGIASRGGLLTSLGAHGARPLHRARDTSSVTPDLPTRPHALWIWDGGVKEELCIFLYLWQTAVLAWLNSPMERSTFQPEWSPWDTSGHLPGEPKPVLQLGSCRPH